MTVTDCLFLHLIGERHVSRIIQTVRPSCSELLQVEHAAGLTMPGTTGCQVGSRDVRARIH